MNFKKIFIGFLTLFMMMILITGCALNDTLQLATPTIYFTPTMTKPTATPSPHITPSPTAVSTPVPVYPQIEYVSLLLSNQTQTDYTTITMVGDCTLGSQRFQDGKSNSFNSFVGSNYFYPFEGAFPLFAQDDLTIINLESTLTASTDYVKNKKYTFKGPKEYVNILSSSSVEMANLVNNHSIDYKEQGYTDTVKTLQDSSITPILFDTPAYFETATHVKIGVIGLYFPNDSKEVKKRVQQARQGGAQIVVVSAHWGNENKYQPTNVQIQMARDAIDAGADIVFGQHPHVLQPMEQYKGKVIFYSLGNFSFGGNLNPTDKDTAVIQANFARNEKNEMQLCEIRVYPYRLSGVDYRNDFRPVPAKPEQQEQILKKLGLVD